MLLRLPPRFRFASHECLPIFASAKSRFPRRSSGSAIIIRCRWRTRSGRLRPVPLPDAVYFLALLLVLPAVGAARRGFSFAAGSFLGDCLALRRYGFGIRFRAPPVGGWRVTSRAGSVAGLNGLLERLGSFAVPNVRAIHPVVLPTGLGDVNNDGAATTFLRRRWKQQPGGEKQTQAQAQRAHAPSAAGRFPRFDHTAKTDALRRRLQNIYVQGRVTLSLATAVSVFS